MPTKENNSFLKWNVKKQHLNFAAERIYFLELLLEHAKKNFGGTVGGSHVLI